MTPQMGIGLAAVALAAVPLGSAQAQSSSLDQAFGYYDAGRYAQAGNLAAAYLRQNGRGFQAEYLRARADAQLNCPNSRVTQSLFQTIRNDYSLTPALDGEVGQWQAYCHAQPVGVSTGATHCDGDVCSTSSPMIVRPSPPQARAGRASPALKHVVATSTVVSAPPAGMTPLIGGTDLPGNDYRQFGAPSSSLCVAVCAREARCRTVSYVVSSRLCWLKATVPAPVRNPDVMSSLKYVR